MSNLKIKLQSGFLEINYYSRVPFCEITFHIPSYFPNISSYSFRFSTCFVIFFHIFLIFLHIIHIFPHIKLGTSYFPHMFIFLLLCKIYNFDFWIITKLRYFQPHFWNLVHWSSLAPWTVQIHFQLSSSHWKIRRL